VIDIADFKGLKIALLRTYRIVEKMFAPCPFTNKT